jgi:hypothetical protein
MTLQYRRSDGALLYLESGADIGKLARECCCRVGTDPCDCDPALDATYTVTLAGFTDNWADFNGTWDIDWTDGCTWSGEFDVIGTPAIDLTISMSWDATNEWWEVTLGLPGSCGIQFTLASTNPCSTPPRRSWGGFTPATGNRPLPLTCCWIPISS